MNLASFRSALSGRPARRNDDEKTDGAGSQGQYGASGHAALDSDLHLLKQRIRKQEKKIRALSSAKRELLGALTVASDRSRRVQDNSTRLIDQFRSKTSDAERRAGAQNVELQHVLESTRSSVQRLQDERNRLQSANAQLHRDMNELQAKCLADETGSAQSQHYVASLTQNLKLQADKIEELTIARQDIERKLHLFQCDLLDGSDPAAPAVAHDGLFVQSTWVARRMQAQLLHIAEQKEIIQNVVTHKQLFLQEIQAAAEQSDQLPSVLVRERLEQAVRDLSSLLDKDNAQYARFDADAKELQSVSVARSVARREKLLFKYVRKHERHVLLNAFSRLGLNIQSIHIARLNSVSGSLSTRIRAQRTDLKQRMLGIMLQKTQMQNGFALKSSFANWKLFVAKRKALREKLERLIVEGQHGSEASYFHKWKEFVATSRLREEALALKRKVDMANQAQIERLKHIFRNKSAASNVQLQKQTMAAWKTFVADRKDRRRAILGRLVHALSGGLVKCFNTWKNTSQMHLVDSLRQQLAQSQRNAYKQREAIKSRMSHALRKHRERVLTSVIFVSWRKALKLRRLRLREFTQAHRIVRQRRRHRTRGVVFRTWMRMARERLQHKAAMNKFITQLFRHSRDGVLRAALNRWRQFTEQTALLELRQKMNAQSSATRNRVVHMIKRQWRSSHLGPVFDTWREHARLSAERREKLMGHCFLRMAMGRVLDAFQVWKQFVENTKVAAMKQQMDSENARLHGVLQRHKQAAVHALIRRWRQHSLEPQFEMWREHAARSRANRLRVLSVTFKRLAQSQEWRAFRQWKEFVEHEKLADMQRELSSMRGQLRQQREQAARNLMRRWRHGAIVPVFDQWRHNAQLNIKRKKELLTRTMLRMAHSQLYAGWRTWCHFTEYDKLHKKEEEVGDLRAQIKFLREQLGREKRTRANLLVEHLRDHKLVPAFEKWREHARRARGEREHMLDLVFKRLSQAKLWCAFRQWKAVVEHEKEAELKEKLTRMEGRLEQQRQSAAHAIIRRWRHGAIAPVFEQWRKNAEAQRTRKRELLSRTAVRMIHSKLYMGWRQWRDVVEHAKVAEMNAQLGKLQGQLRKQREQAAQNIMRRWRHGAIVPVFETWRANAEAQRARKRELLSRTAARMINNKVWQGFRHWKDWVATARKAETDGKIIALQKQLDTQRETAVQNILRRWRHGAIVPVFQAWRKNAHDRAGRRDELLGRTFLRMVHSKMFAAWRTWRSFVAQSRVADMRRDLLLENQRLRQLLLLRKQEAVHALVRTRRMAGLQPVFDRWREHAARAAERKEELLGRTFTRLSQAKLWCAFRQWAHFVEHTKEAEFKSQLQKMQGRLQQQQDAAAHAIIRRWRHGAVAPVFEEWRKNAEAQRTRKRELLSRTAVRMIHSKLYMGWRQWRDVVEHAKVAEMNAQLGKLQGQLRKQREQAAQNIMRRWRHGAIVPVFETWRANAEAQRARKRELLSRTAARMINNKVWQGFRHWKDWVATARKAETDGKIIALQKQLDTQRETAVQNILRRWRHGAIVPVFDAWRKNARDRAGRRKELLGRTFVRMLHVKVFAAWRSWRDFVEGSRVAEIRGTLSRDYRTAVMVGVLQRRLTCAQAAAMNHWVRHTAWRRAADVRLHHNKEVVQRTMVRMAAGKVWQAWRQWRKVVEQKRIEEMEAKFTALSDAQSRSKKLAAQRVLSRWRNNHQATVFATWRTNVARSLQNRGREKELLGRMLTRMASANLWQGWRQWLHFVEQEKVHSFQRQLRLQKEDMEHKLAEQKQTMVKRLIRQWRVRDEATVFATWREHTSRSREQKREVLQRTSARMLSAAMYRAFRQWRHFVDEEKIAGLKRQFVDKQKSERKHALVAMVQRWQGRQSSHVFLEWRAWARARKVRRVELLGRSCQRLVFGKAACAFRRWRWFTGEARLWELKQKMLAEVEQARKETKDKQIDRLHSFFTWRVSVMAAKLARALEAVAASERTLNAADRRQKREASMLEQGNEKVRQQLAGYADEVMQLRRRLEGQTEQVKQLTHEKSELASRLNGALRQSKTRAQFAAMHKEERAVRFARSIILARCFKRLFDNAQRSRLQRRALGRCMMTAVARDLRSALAHWRRCAEDSVRASLRRKVAQSEVQIHKLLRKISRLEFRVADRKAHGEASKEMNTSMRALNDKINALMAEVDERGKHIQYLVEENSKLSGVAASSSSALALRTGAHVAAGVGVDEREAEAKTQATPHRLPRTPPPLGRSTTYFPTTPRGGSSSSSSSSSSGGSSSSSLRRSTAATGGSRRAAATARPRLGRTRSALSSGGSVSRTPRGTGSVALSRADLFVSPAPLHSALAPRTELERMRASAGAAPPASAAAAGGRPGLVRSTSHLTRRQDAGPEDWPSASEFFGWQEGEDGHGAGGL